MWNLSYDHWQKNRDCTLTECCKEARSSFITGCSSLRLKLITEMSRTVTSSYHIHPPLLLWANHHMEPLGCFPPADRDYSLENNLSHLCNNVGRELFFSVSCSQ
ncbi:hypothetical protein CHARACLAT_028776 [Characodon lateralis]|uniref:Uncharacterized protein n=1 Tax=Characodon lateralis TaxID=208331 RepID=A0ABU7F6V4_9TELE|nr:hypothetical protein [Characodon lateralis]